MLIDINRLDFLYFKVIIIIIEYNKGIDEEEYMLFQSEERRRLV